MISAIRTTHAAITFIELLIVIIIISVVAGVSLPQIKKTFDNFELENFAKELYYVSNYLRGSAIGEGKIYYLAVNKERNEFRALLVEADEFKTMSGRFGKLYTAPAATLVSLEPPEKTGVYFYPDGSSDPVTVTLENRNKKNISLVIKGATGEIQIR